MLKRYLFLPLTAALAVMLALSSAPTLAEHSVDVDLEREAVPFLVKMDIGDPDHTIAVNGDLRVFVRCSDPGDGFPKMETFGTSTAPFFGPLLHFITIGTAPPHPANFLSVLNTADVDGSTVFANITTTNKGTFVQTGTHYIGLDADTTSLAMNLFGFDCFTAGTAVLISEEIDDDDDD